MAEWHLPPDYISNNWTDELLELMLKKLLERKKREARALPPASTGDSGGHKVPDSVLFSRAANLVKVVKN